MFYKRLTTDWTKKKGIAQFDRSSTLKHVSLSVEIPDFPAVNLPVIK